MFYLMSKDSEILDELTRLPTQEKLDEMANFFGCSVWVMRGEHAGMSAEPRELDEREGSGRTVRC